VYIPNSARLLALLAGFQTMDCKRPWVTRLNLTPRKAENPSYH
jgi:hypothetical protein